MQVADSSSRIWLEMLYYYYLLLILLNVIHISGNPRIIHRDIKSSNILLDFNYEAKVSVILLIQSLIVCSIMSIQILYSNL